MADGTDAVGSFISGARGGQELVSKAYELEKQKADLEQNKQNVALQKFDLVQNDLKQAYVLPKGQIRDKFLERTRQRLTTAGIAFDPQVLDLAKTDDYQADLFHSFDSILSEPDQAKRAAGATSFLAAGGDISTTLKGLEESAKLRNELAKHQTGKDNPLNTIDSLRNERNQLPTTKRTAEIVEAYQKVRGAAKEPSAAGDLSLIFGYMKMLDPGSVVREGEFASAANARGIPDAVRGAYNKALTGEKLVPQQRTDFVNRAREIYTNQLDFQTKNVDNFYADRARSQGLDPKFVIQSLTLSPSQGQALSGAQDQIQQDMQNLRSQGFSDDQIAKLTQALKAKRKQQLGGSSGKSKSTK